MPTTLFVEHPLPTHDLPFSVQEPSEGGDRLIYDARGHQLDEHVHYVRLATSTWEDVTTVQLQIRDLMRDYDEPMGILLPSRVRGEGYGATALIYVREEDVHRLGELLSSVQDQEHQQPPSEIRSRFVRSS